MKALVLHYGVGNVFSVSHAFRRLGFEAVVSEKLRRDVDCLVMPGVGNFSPAAEKISSIREELVDFVMSGAPVLGICLGMQLFFEESEEGPGKGLGVFRGKVVGLPPTVKRPHMGWNIIRRTRQNPLLEDVENEWVYFNHSYHPSPADPNIILAETNYGISFPAVVGKDMVFGTQFHPEKSSTAGEKILRNFVKFVRR